MIAAALTDSDKQIPRRRKDEERASRAWPSKQKGAHPQRSFRLVKIVRRRLTTRATVEAFANDVTARGPSKTRLNSDVATFGFESCASRIFLSPPSPCATTLAPTPTTPPVWNASRYKFVAVVHDHRRVWYRSVEPFLTCALPRQTSHPTPRLSGVEPVSAWCIGQATTTSTWTTTATATASSKTFSLAKIKTDIWKWN